MSARVARPLTLIAALPESLCAKYSRHDILGKLLTVLQPDRVSCIQFVPKRYVRITLKTFDVRQAVLQSGITIESFCLTVFEADPVTVEVSVEHLPFEVPDQDLHDVLSPFGTILNVRLQKYADSDIFTGTRIVTMSLASDIPLNLRVLRYPCRVLYRGQPRPCPVCRSDGHRVSLCPLRDKCRRCLQPGHFARDCKVVVPEPDPSFVSDDESTEDGDESDASEECVSGDEEVVEAISSPTPPTVPVTSSALPSVCVEPEVAASVAPLADPVPSSPPENVSSDNTAPRVKRRTTNVTSAPFKWILRYPEDFRDTVLGSGHTSDSHVIQETYHTSDHKFFYNYGILDFGVNTFRVLKDVRTFEDVHLRAYDHGLRFKNIFPGIKAVNGQSLPPNIVPSKFPASI